MGMLGSWGEIMLSQSQLLKEIHLSEQHFPWARFIICTFEKIHLNKDLLVEINNAPFKRKRPL